jgi:hypothetical protein
VIKFLRNLFSTPYPIVNETDGKGRLQYIVNKLGLDGRGPEAGDDIDRKTIVYHENATWIIEYDAKTNRLITAKCRTDGYQV